MILSTGLFDLQVNGYAGVDFNDSAITAAAMDSALEAMLAAGVTQCLPTLITAHSHELRERFLALDAAVAASRLGPRMVPAIISKVRFSTRRRAMPAAIRPGP